MGSGDWQPIETANVKELEESGEYILACVAGSKIPVPTGYDDGWYAINNCFKDWKPTHWMPLPTPPDTDGVARLK